MRFSRRSDVSQEENALTRALGEARLEGRSILDLTLSNPTIAELPYDATAITRAFTDPAILRYAPEPLGMPSARRAVADAFRVPTERVMLTASTSEAYAMLLGVLCDPGDRVLAPEPSYPLLAHLAALSGVALSPYALRWDGTWHVDPASVRESAASGARAVLAVSPNNPTGSVLRQSDLDALYETKLPLVVDEVFLDYPLESEARSAYDTERPQVVVGGLSKLAGLPQVKVGWILVGGGDAFADPLLRRLTHSADAFLSVSTPSMLALPHLLEGRVAVAQAIRERTRDNLATLRRLLPDTSAITVPTVEAGWYACLRLPRTRTDEGWALRLLAADGVLVQPGYFYDFAEDGWLVISLLTPPEAFGEGVARVIARVDADA